MKTKVYIVSISLILMSIPGTSRANRRLKRGNAENFAVLLNIYKINPLKHSNVFKTFSNRVLLPGPDGCRTALNFNLNESRENDNSTNTKSENEEVINYAKHKSVDRPLYVEEGTPERFEPGHFLSKLVSMNRVDFNAKENEDRNVLNDDLVRTSTVQSDIVQNYTNNTKNYSQNITIEEIAKIQGNLEDLSYVNYKMPYDIAETVVVK